MADGGAASASPAAAALPSTGDIGSAAAEAAAMFD